MQKLKVLVIILSIIILAAICVSCDCPDRGKVNKEIYVEDRFDSEQSQEYISDLTSYVRQLSKTKSYDSVKRQMALLNISEEEYYDSENHYFGNMATIASATLGSADTKINPVLFMEDNLYNGLSVKYSIVSSHLNLEGVDNLIFRVSANLDFADFTPSKYNDLIEIMCDYEMLPLDKQIFDYSEFDNFNKIIIDYEDANGESQSVTKTDFESSSKFCSSTFSLSTSSYDRVTEVWIYREFSLTDTAKLAGMPQYYSFAISYAKAYKYYDLSSIGFGVSASSSGVFPGVSASFTHKEDYSICSTAFGTWAYNTDLPITEGEVYRVRNNQGTGLFGLLNRWMLISGSEINSGATVTTSSNNNSFAQRFTFIPGFDSSGVYYKILPYHVLGYCIGVEGNSIKMLPDGNSTNLKFRIERVGSNYKILTYDGSLCLGLNGDTVQTEIYSGAKDQLWDFQDQYVNFKPNENLEYIIENKNSGLAVDISGGSATNGANLIQYGVHAESNQRFVLKYVGNGEYQIVSAIAPNRCVTIDVNGGGNVNGANVYLADNFGGDNQKFKIVKAAIDHFKILTKISGFAKCLSVDSVSIESGANIHQWDFEETTSELNRDNNLWRFV